MLYGVGAVWGMRVAGGHVSGTLALVGSGEFLAVMRPIDALLLERASQSGRVHVVCGGDSQRGHPRWPAGG